MIRENNPYLRRLEAIDEAKKKWSESEWLLTFLRSETGVKQRTLTDEEILQWEQKLH